MPLLCVVALNMSCAANEYAEMIPKATSFPDDSFHFNFSTGIQNSDLVILSMHKFDRILKPIFEFSRRD